jgi:hypothetical protein
VSEDKRDVPQIEQWALRPDREMRIRLMWEESSTPGARTVTVSRHSRGAFRVILAATFPRGTGD